MPARNRLKANSAKSFWNISKEEALEWAKRCPLPQGAILDIYQIFEPPTDFPPELRPQSAKA
ncbi:MAG: hypothetical protein WA690_25600 [Candidatus Acidiferrales bacterium]